MLTKNGLQIDENLKTELTKEQLAEYVKRDFELLKKSHLTK